MGGITVYKAKAEILTGMPAPTFKTSLSRLQVLSLLNFKDRHKYGFEITKWTGGPDVRQSEAHPNPSNPGSIPPTAILDSGSESRDVSSCTIDQEGQVDLPRGDRGIKSLQLPGVDRGSNRTHATAKSKGGRGSNEYQDRPSVPEM